MQNFSKAERIAAAVYFIWFFIHLGLFFSAEETTDPLTGIVSQPAYDVIDFVLYVGSPLILFIAYKIVFTNDEESESYGGHQHSGRNFLIAFLDEKIKAEELAQKINELTHQPVSGAYLAELKTDREKAANKGINGWLGRAEVKKKYRDFQE